MRAIRRRAFTLVELMVVVAIIGVLLGLILPAVQKVREAANRTKCQNNLRQVGVAFLNYHNSHERFPSARWGAPSGNGLWFSAFAAILPYVEQDNVARRYNPSLPIDDASDSDGDGISNADITRMNIPTFLCPSMIVPEAYERYSTGAPGVSTPTAFAMPRSSYMGCAGSEYAYTISKGDGVIVPVSATIPAVRVNDISDGTAMTFLAGETDYVLQYKVVVPGTNNCVPTAYVWGQWSWGFQGASYTTTYSKFNQHHYFRSGAPLCSLPTTGDCNDIDVTAFPNSTAGPNPIHKCWNGQFSFKSQHPGGAHFVYADGSVRLLNEKIDLATYRALSTRAGGEAVAGQH
jgi:prepilin-type N-terminal cleavage/methylation domain-containing protein/prepilin-type processing-associated H-X9-DG protein